MNLININIQNIRSNINYWTILLFIFWLPLKDDYLPLILAIWIFTWLLEGNFKTRLIPFENKPFYIALASYFLLTVIALSYSNDLKYGVFQIQEKLSMLFFPIFLMGSNKIIKQNFNTVFIAFILGNIVASIYCLANALFISVVHENGVSILRYTHWLSMQDYSFWDLVNMRVSNFSYTYLSILKHPAYFTMYLLFSICILAYLMRKKWIKKKWIKIAAYTLILYFSFIIYLLQSRAGLISLAFVFFLIILIEIQSNLKKRYFILIIAVTVIFGFVILSSSKIDKNISELKEIYINPTSFSLNNSDTRFQLWYTSIQVIKDNFWFGTSPANLTDQLVIKYKELGFKSAEKEQLNSHNQYLETFAGLGIFGFISLIFILIYGFVISIKKHNYLLFLLILIISFNFLFESALNRMAGILFMMFFISLLIFANIPEFNGKIKLN